MTRISLAVITVGLVIALVVDPSLASAYIPPVLIAVVLIVVSGFLNFVEDHHELKERK